jgi:hypothetical protein
MATLQRLPRGFITSATIDNCIQLERTVFYQIHVQTLQGEWYFSCRYSQLRDLARRVNSSGAFRHDQSGLRSSFDLADGMPGKTASWFHKLTAAETEQRRIQLHNWLQALLLSPLAHFIRPMIYNFLQVPQHTNDCTAAQQVGAQQRDGVAVAIAVAEEPDISQAMPSASITQEIPSASSEQDPAQQKGASDSVAVAVTEPEAVELVAPSIYPVLGSPNTASVVSVQVPVGVAPGSTIQVNTENGPIEVVVPAGVRAMQSFAVTLPVASASASAVQVQAPAPVATPVASSDDGSFALALALQQEEDQAAEI